MPAITTIITLNHPITTVIPLYTAGEVVWILATGLWNDDGVWDDTAVWID